MPWWTFSLVSALIFGFTYPLCERLLGVTTWRVLGLAQAVMSLVVYMAIVASTPQVGDELARFRARPSLWAVLVLYVGLNVIASLAGTLAIRSKNATLASIIEVSYLALIPIVSVLFFGRSGLNAGSLVGALLIAAGVVVVIVYG